MPAAGGVVAAAWTATAACLATGAGAATVTAVAVTAGEGGRMQARKRSFSLFNPGFLSTLLPLSPPRHVGRLLSCE